MVSAIIFLRDFYVAAERGCKHARCWLGMIATAVPVAVVRSQQYNGQIMGTAHLTLLPFGYNNKHIVHSEGALSMFCSRMS
jgi:hypothetical protein